jgi:hypothetical protein
MWNRAAYWQTQRGHISDLMSAFGTKRFMGAINIPLAPSGKSPLEAGPSHAREEGRIAIVTNVGRGMRLDAVGVPDECTSERAAKPCGPDIPTLISS